MPFVEVEALGEEQELALPLLEQVAGARHLRLGGVLARAGEVHVGLLHVVAEADVVEICGALKVRGPPFVLNKVSLVCQTITGLTHSAVTLIRC